MAERSEVSVSAGTLRDDSPLLHVAVGGCVLNDVYREAEDLGLDVFGVRVVVSGGFDATTWASTGITSAVDVDAAASDPEVAALLDRVESVAEIPKAIAHGAPVTRAAHSG